MCGAHARRQQDFGIGRDDGLRRYRRHQKRLARKDIAATAQRQHVGEDVLAVERHQRLLPHLIEHLHRWLACIAVAQRIDLLAELLCGIVSAGARVEQRAECFDGARNVAHVVRFGEEQRNAQCTQAVDLLLRITVAPDHHQIGFERSDALQIERTVVAHVRNVACGRRIVAVGHRADDARAAARCKQQLSRMRCQADDALCRVLQGDRGAGVIGDGNGGKRRCSSNGQCSKAKHTQTTGKVGEASGHRGGSNGERQRC